MQINQSSMLTTPAPAKLENMVVPEKPEQSTSKNEAASQHDPIEKYVQYAKEHGLMALIEKFPEFKAEEVRAEMLENLGLTEESFQALPAEQQARINEMIKEKVEIELYGHIKESPNLGAVPASIRTYV